MATTNKTQEAQRQENIEATVSKTEKFFNEYKKTIVVAVTAVLVLGLGVLAYSKFIYGPKCEEAMAQAYVAEMNFQKGEWELALNGDGNVPGFVQVIDQYGAKSGESVYLYAGICELQLGNYESAISYLQKYNGKEPILAARAIACQGDAYVGLQDYRSAVDCFTGAAAKADNAFAASYLLKAGLAYEKLGDKASALSSYKTIKEQYPMSFEAYEIDRYISAVEE